jgi:hypothetical protein
MASDGDFTTHWILGNLGPFEFKLSLRGPEDHQLLQALHTTIVATIAPGTVDIIRESFHSGSWASGAHVALVFEEPDVEPDPQPAVPEPEEAPLPAPKATAGAIVGDSGLEGSRVFHAAGSYDVITGPYIALVTMPTAVGGIHPARMNRAYRMGQQMARRLRGEINRFVAEEPYNSMPRRDRFWVVTRGWRANQASVGIYAHRNDFSRPAVLGGQMLHGHGYYNHVFDVRHQAYELSEWAGFPSLSESYAFLAGLGVDCCNVPDHRVARAGKFTPSSELSSSPAAEM